jgi:hypothetical protein
VALALTSDDLLLLLCTATARQRYVQYLRLVCDLHVRAALAYARCSKPQLDRARACARVAARAMIDLETIELIAGGGMPGAKVPTAAAPEEGVRFGPALASHYRTLAMLLTVV